MKKYLYICITLLTFCFQEMGLKAQDMSFLHVNGVNLVDVQGNKFYIPSIPQPY